MITTTNAMIVAIAPGSDTAMMGCVVILLLALLAIKELVQTSCSESLLRLSKFLSIGIFPLLFVFAVIIVSSISRAVP